MKKYIILVLALVFVVAVCMGCSNQSSYHPTEVGNVSISISDASATGATVTIKDTNEESYTYGEWYEIEKERNGKWYKIKTAISEYGFNDVGYLVNDNDELVLTVDWEWLYGKLPSGNYRLLKEVDSKYIAVEFSVVVAE